MESRTTQPEEIELVKLGICPPPAPQEMTSKVDLSNCAGQEPSGFLMKGISDLCLGQKLL